MAYREDAVVSLSALDALVGYRQDGLSDSHPMTDYGGAFVDEIQLLVELEPRRSRDPLAAA